MREGDRDRKLISFLIEARRRASRSTCCHQNQNLISNAIIAYESKLIETMSFLLRESSRMNDIWPSITQLLDDGTIMKLHLLGLDLNLISSSKSQRWWYRRVCILTSTSVAFRASSWKQAYIILKRCLSNFRVGMDNFRGSEEDNPLVIDVLLDMGFPVPQGVVSDCVRIGLPLALRALFCDPRAKIDKSDLLPCRLAIDEDKGELLQLILEYVTQTDGLFSWLLFYATDKQSIGCIRVLLADGRANVSCDNNSIVCKAIMNRSKEILLLLLNHPTFDWELLDIRVVESLFTEGNVVDDAADFVLAVPQMQRLLTIVLENESRKTEEMRALLSTID